MIFFLISQSYMTVGSILSCEVVAGEFRDCTGVVYTVMWTIGYVYVGVLTLCIRKWRYLYLAATLPGAITLIYIWLLPESPHWMASHRDIKGLQKYVDTATIFNSKQVNLNDCVVTEEVQKRPEWEIRRTVLDLFRWKRLLFMISINGFIVLVMNFYYFALSFDSVYLSEDKLTGYLLMGLVELPAGIIAVPVMHRFGRRSISVVCLATQGLILLTAVVFDGMQINHIDLILIGKTMNSIAFVAHPLLVTEMIPTTLRTVAYSFVNIPESIGILTSPLLKYADLEGGKIPCLILGCLSLVAALLAVVLPETKGHPMPEDIEDMQLGPFLEFFKRRSQRNHT
ncbi:hypothetical protein AB6A40_002865 [Gnathostoma spinigerum]|uniref:Major facilitator superfamily (MFS) profile domain-containing protein n=1 Tax=Gnathostoma spinigerum TaxID=75299 RepID=A0ABD6EAC5_9BILA